MRRATLALLILSAIVPLSAQPANRQPGPNVVLIITDDVGYGDLGSYGAPDIKTPNIDRLAREGVRFTDFYSNGHVCTPTRTALISGRYQQRVGLETVFSASPADRKRGLPVTGHSLPQLMKNHGYATALVGKWHLGYLPEFGPNAHGFDHYFGFLGGAVDYFRHSGTDGEPDLVENTTPVRETGYLTDIITRRSVEFINQNAGRPFFLEVAYNAAHWPFQSPRHPPDAYASGRPIVQWAGDELNPTRRDYAEMLERADEGVGQILAALDKRGLARNTLVIFTNDNGGEWLSRNAPLFHRKGTLWEGGIRVPAIIKWPGHVPVGKTTAQVGITLDLTTTILAAAGATIPADARFDGVDLVPLIQNGKTEQQRTIFWRTPNARPMRAVRHGQWKLLADGQAIFLFDLSKDIGERNDLSSVRQDLVTELRQKIVAWEKDVDSEFKFRTKPTQ
jgi:arylsulfatase A-like enzyme